MATCLHCKHAKWHLTATGKLHQSGEGECKYPWEMPKLPASMYWIGKPPTPYGSLISRKKELKAPCEYFLTVKEI